MRPPHRVLFVEDYAPFKRSFARLLSRRFGLAVTVADSGEEAIGEFGALNPDLVIMDIGLPGVDGTETLQVIRALPGGDRVPVIVLTGSNDPESRNAAEQLDIEGYVLKENVTGEFDDILFSIFPDLGLAEQESFRTSEGSIALHTTLDVQEATGRPVGRTPRSHRTVRVLLPEQSAKRPLTTKPWTHRMVRRAQSAFPRVFGDTK